jgi:aarF domain-containing kinase
VPPEADRGEVVPALAGVFAKALAGGVDSLAFGALLGDLGQAMYRFQFRVPPYFTLLVRSLSVLEGIALAADPRYKVLGAAYPWVARRLLTDRSPELRATLLSLLYRTPGKLDFGRLESLLTQATRRGGGTAASRAREGAAAAAVGGSAAGDALALLLSPDGEFVRGVLVEELAKGADAATRLFLDSAVGEARAALAAAELGPPAGGTVLLRSLHDALAAVPPLADAADAEQVAGLRRLAAALQAATAEARAQAAAAPSGSARGAAAAAGAAAGAPPDAQRALEELAALAEWAAREAAALAPAERAEALRLPLEVAQAVASRAAARAIRFATSGSPTAPPPPGRAAPFSAGDAAADDDDAVLRGSRCAAGPPSPA